MSSPLVDPEGFPRADIDVYTVRHARAALVRLRNDHRAVVEEMARALGVVYAVQEGAGDSDVGGRAETRSVEMGGEMARALARVNAVAPGSPAAQAVSPALGADRRDPNSPLVLLRRELISPRCRAWRRTTSSSNSDTSAGHTHSPTSGRSSPVPKECVRFVSGSFAELMWIWAGRVGDRGEKGWRGGAARVDAQTRVGRSWVVGVSVCPCGGNQVLTPVADVIFYPCNTAWRVRAFVGRLYRDCMTVSVHQHCVTRVQFRNGTSGHDPLA